MENTTSPLQRRIWLGPLIAILLLALGFGLGLVVGWFTVQFKPSADDIAAAADSYSLNNNRELARQRLSGLAKSEQEKLLNRMIQDANAGGKGADAQRLSALGQALGLGVTSVASSPGATAVPTRSSSSTPSATTPAASPLAGIGLLGGLLLLIVIVVGAAGWILFAKILPQLRSRQASPPVRRAPPAPTPSAPPPVQLRTMAQRETPPPARMTSAPMPAPKPTPQPAPAAAVRTAPAPAPMARPAQGGLGRFVATYAIGNDNYDTSFSLESSRQEFLGECGMGISETIGEGKPDKVTAFDLWLFDKADVRTVTQILMSEFAYEEQSLRAKLAAKGELVRAEKGAVIEMETQSLLLKAQIVELVYATNPSFPANSHFQKLVVEILPSLKEPVPA